MTSTIELQVSAQKFTDQVLQTLLAKPRPLPDPYLGMQLQRVRYRGASLRRDVIASYRLMHVNAGHDQGPGYYDISARQTQLAVDVSVEITAEANIAAQPNRLATPDVIIDGTLVFNLEVKQSSIGVLALETRFRDLEVGISFPSIAGVVDPKQWAMDQLESHLDLKPIKLDLSDTLARGLQFWNQGIALDATGNALIIRAEVADDGNPSRWTDFYNGVITERLGGADWAVVALARDLTLTIKTEIWGRLAQALGQYRVRTVDVQYSGHGDRASFTITPYLEVWEDGVEVFGNVVSASFGISVGYETGKVVVEIDASAADDLADGIRAVIAGLVAAFVPLVGLAGGDSAQRAARRAARRGVPHHRRDRLRDRRSPGRYDGRGYRTLQIPRPHSVHGTERPPWRDHDVLGRCRGGDRRRHMERYEPKPRRVEGDSVAVCTKRSVRVVWRAGLLHPQGIRRRPSPLDQYACEAKLTTTGTASVSVDKVIPVRMPATDGSTGAALEARARRAKLAAARRTDFGRSPH